MVYCFIRLVDAHFGSAFTEYGGVETLLGLATEREDPPEVQAQALAALSSAIAFPQAMERLLSADGAARLVRITHADTLASEHIASAVCAALDLLSALCMRSDGFVIVHGATVRIASEREEPSHAQLVKLVEPRHPSPDHKSINPMRHLSLPVVVIAAGAASSTAGPALRIKARRDRARAY